MALRLGPLPGSSDSLDDAEDDQADPEIHNQAQVEAWSDVARSGRQVGHDQEIDRIPRQYSDQRVHEIAHS